MGNKHGRYMSSKLNYPSGQFPYKVSMAEILHQNKYQESKEEKMK
jgi:hypothetical protein